MPVIKVKASKNDSRKHENDSRKHENDTHENESAQKRQFEKLTKIEVQTQPKVRDYR